MMNFNFVSATNIYGIIIVSVGTTALLLVLAIFIDTLLYIMKNSSPMVKAHSAFVIGVYPVTSLATYFAILVPRAHLLAESITQGMFMAGMKTVRILRLLVLQLPVVQGLVYVILLVMWAEREAYFTFQSLYQINYMYIQPVMICSILTGIWGMSMTINILKTKCEKYLLIGKFLALQMVLIFAKLQGLSTKALVWFHVLPCRPPITPQVYANLIHNTLMLSEMVLLGAIARYLYKQTLPEITNRTTRISTIGGIMTSECVNNNIICNNFNTYCSQDKKIDSCYNGVDNMGAEINE
ncbi:hypothetical protein NQ317_002449 [Molorchus minor]|uniref:Organic solute transporter alpha-like protein n=1 Tax=Molorchus minor TaxID=1323400 RepID=A0ABQ9J713_9CUCU|nr:hypothetical protein NQ317_002449 [Molorchus minor]